MSYFGVELEFAADGVLTEQLGTCHLTFAIAFLDFTLENHVLIHWRSLRRFHLDSDAMLVHMMAASEFTI